MSLCYYYFSCKLIFAVKLIYYVLEWEDDSKLLWQKILLQGGKQDDGAFVSAN